MDKTLTPTANIANKVKNTKLPRTQPLLPLFEVVSNAIHSIDEAVKIGILASKNAYINIRIIRNGDEATLASLSSIDKYPIVDFEIEDNGVGFTDENLSFFVESDTDHKVSIGGKGVGRFVCLKAFKKMHIRSIYMTDNDLMSREFDFMPTKEGFGQYSEDKSHDERKTIIYLIGYKEEYAKNAPKDIMEIAREIVTHFQLYFLNGDAPEITISNQNNLNVNLNRLFEQEYVKQIEREPFDIGEHHFEIILTKSYKALSHKLVFCAHNRAVKIEGLYQKIIDLGKYSIKSEDGNNDGFYYQAFVTGKVLDNNVDVERTSFDLANEDNDDDCGDDISLSKIRNEALNAIEKLLSEYLNAVRKAKIEKYKPVIDEEMPQYRNIVRYKEDKVKLLSPNLSKEKLDIEL